MEHLFTFVSERIKENLTGFRFNFTRCEDWCQFEVNNHYKDFDKSSVKEDGVRMHLISRSNDIIHPSSSGSGKYSSSSSFMMLVSFSYRYSPIGL